MSDNTNKEYILHSPPAAYAVTPYSILRKRLGSETEYETVIPDAGVSKKFAMNLVSLLNSQGSEVGQTSE